MNNTKFIRNYSERFCSLLIIIFLVVLSVELKANDINVKNVRLTGQVNGSHTFVNFDLNWKNSWRNSTNWDAAWLFVKYKVGSGEWLHATLSSVAGEHTISSGSAISPSSDGKGVFIYRSADGTGENNFAGISLRWNYDFDGVLNDAQVTVKVFAIEMVYIPQGSFYVGDGVSDSRFHISGDPSTPFQINSESALTIDGTTPGSLWATGNMETGNIPIEYPKGYKAFYLMKYEITQGQYTDFLNMLNADQIAQRFDPSITGYRYTITGSYPTLTTNRPSRACNNLAYVDGAAYADWAALRPITEFELEKACRGPASPVAEEYAWGNTNIDHDGDINGVEDGTETVTNGLNVNHTVIFTNTYGGDGGEGPVRSGIFAATHNTREGSGGTFYGVMEMSGNLWETIVSSGLEYSRSFDGSPGDGMLSINGNATNLDWPGYSSGEIISDYGSGGRGGGFNGSEDRLRISDRFYSNSLAYREWSNGFRCARTAE